MTKSIRLFFAVILPLFLGIFLLMALQPAEALVSPSVLTVDTLVDENDGSCFNGDCSLRDALANSSGGITVTFSVSGVIDISTLGELAISKDIYIQGGNAITVSGGNAARVFNVSAGQVTIDGLSIVNGVPAIAACGPFSFECGGGLFLANNTVGVTLTNSTLSDNSALQGGGIYNFGGTVHIINSTIANNTANSGGGIYNRAGVIQLTNAELNGNSSTGSNGGGILADGGALIIENSSLSDNSAFTSGGAIYNRNSGVVQVSNTTISNNRAINTGGGGILNVAFLTLSASTVSGNSALQDGGGIFNTGGVMTVTNSTLSGNTTGQNGGGAVNFGTATFLNSTITDNQAAIGGGGISSEGNSFITTALTNTIAAGNVISGTAVASDLTLLSTTTDSFRSGGHNLIGAVGANIGAFSAAGDQTGINAPGLGPLQDNGGETFTHELLSNSPALNAGRNIDCPAVDQRGLMRPQGGTCDIGAYEIEYSEVYIPFIARP
ncbi:MAG: right-handed parallel beta-helix repeat-containing protein [Ardenticatenaceae bacterium]|nr:right-handed parallel beta-helix repeat-containing protein [Ardenticatenaceae bacterium]